MLQNLRFLLRTWRKQPALTLTILITLALGIGATTAIFTVDYAALIAPPPYPHPEQLVYVWSKINGNPNGVSAGDFTDWVQQSHSFQKLAGQTDDSFNVGSGDRLENMNGQYVTPGFYDMLDGPGQFFLGRDFLPEEGVAGKNNVVIITHKLWMHLGSDRNLKTPMRINGEPYTVVGVLPEGQMDQVWSQLILPLVFKPEQLNHDFHWLQIWGRLKDGVTVQQAQADMDTVTANIARANPKSSKGWGAMIETFQHAYIDGGTRTVLWLLLGACAFLLLIACVNVANLLLARGTARHKEIAVRTALGASPKAIFAQMITESLVLSVLGGALGVGVGFALIRILVAIMPQYTLPTEADVRISIPVLLATLAATTFAGLLSGYAPAWFASRINPNEALKEGGGAGTAAGRHRLRRILVIGEFALALSMLTGAGLAIHSFINVIRVDLGIKVDHVLTFNLSVPDSRPKDPQLINAYYQQMLSAVQAVPGVTSATAMTGLPLQGTGFGMPFTIAGQPAFNDPSQRPGSPFGMITPGFFQTFGVKIVKGRSFTEQDNASAVKVMVVNEVFAKKFFKDKDPLQQRVSVEQLVPGVTKLGPPIEWQVVGVYHTIRGGGGYEYPEMRVPFWQSPWNGANIAVRTAGDPNTMTKSITAAVHSIDSEIALARMRSMDQVREERLRGQRFILTIFSAFAVVALLLAALGIYGVVSFSVAQRKRELAIRIALGANRSRILSLILREGILLAAIGSALGLIGAFFIGRSMQSMLFEIGKIDYKVFALVSLVLLLAAVAACFLPARRATKTNPMQALRTE
jgi:putative ABC transport system permease protein